MGFVAVAGVGGWLYWDRTELRGEQVARDELEPLAAQQIPKVFGYDY
ncbi:MAG TPA: mammalian cell entry protein, partial [Mycobacterium sp.]|nr:mammalian cell entry protein [Mycobacterium sp.]